jgi:RelE-like toxin of type II toxin-antitoxin system HigB
MLNFHPSDVNASQIDKLDQGLVRRAVALRWASSPARQAHDADRQPDRPFARTALPLGELRDMAAPPGNRLEALSGNRKGQHSIRVNDQLRVCFVWTLHGPKDVEIVDYA